MIQPRAAGPILFALCLLTPACHRAPREEALDAPDPQQRSRAAEATAHLQAEFNAGVCDLAYNGGSAFFRSQDAEEWGRQCALLKEELGTWRGFQVDFLQRASSSEPLFLVDGTAQFENGTREIEVAWRLEKDGAQMDSISLRKPEEQRWMHLPPRALTHGPWIDPPPAKSPHTDSAS